MEKTVFLFAGQGAQYAGMGTDLYTQNKTFKNIIDESGEYLKTDLLSICEDAEKQKKTQNAQAAIFSVSYGIYKILEENKIIPDCAAGFSMGEITSFAAAGVLNFRDALKLIKIRGEAMDQACEKTPGEMCGIIGAEDKVIEDICEKISKTTGYIIPANYNCPGQVVISGEIKAINEAVSIFNELKIKTIKLNTAGAFHTKIMEYKIYDLINFLNTLKYKKPEFDLYSNLSGDKLNFSNNKNEDEIKKFFTGYITKQMTNPVKFKQELENMEAEKYINFIEIGPGKTLSGFVKRTCKNAKTINIQNCETLNSTLECFT